MLELTPIKMTMKNMSLNLSLSRWGISPIDFKVVAGETPPINAVRHILMKQAIRDVFWMTIGALCVFIGALIGRGGEPYMIGLLCFLVGVGVGVVLRLVGVPLKRRGGD